MLSSKLMSASSGGAVFLSQSSVVVNALSSITLNIPASRQAGDLIIAFLGKIDNSLYTPPAGWTTKADFGDAGGAGASGDGAPAIFTRVSDGSETTATFTQAKTGCVGVVYLFRGATAGTAGAYANASSGATNPVAPSITMAGSGILFCIAGAINALTYTAPSGMTLKTNSASTTPSLVIYEQSILAAGSTGTRTVGTSGNANALLFPIY